MESVDCMTTSKLDFPKGLNDLKKSNDYEAKGGNFVEPVSHSYLDIESTSKFPNDIVPIKKSPNSQIPNPPEEIYLFDKSEDVYTDKSVTECEPEPVVCYKESSHHIIEDICVDGVPTKDKILFESSVDEKACIFYPSGSYENKDMMNDNIGIRVLNLLETEESDQVSANYDQSNDLMQKVKDATAKLADNVNKEMVVPGDKALLQGSGACRSRPSAEPEFQSQPGESKNTIEAVFTSPALELSIDESDNDMIHIDNMLLENGSITHQFDASAPAACGKEECCKVNCCDCDETQNASKDVTNQVCHRLSESSFSAVGPVSSHISYSGPVTCSGSISLRSDSSTTSTRSFEFPILQSEWNNSPVRMAKADRRHYWKHRRWRQGLLCCKF